MHISSTSAAPRAPHKWSSKARKLLGFTLVETALAMGVIGFGLVGLLGLMPIGMSNYRDARDRTAEAQIFQGLNSRIQQTDYSKLTTVWPGTVYGFDERGIELKDTSKALYTAEVIISDPPSILAASAANASTVSLVITTKTDANRKSRYISYVSNNGR
jgi:uncharacterized protein (TIGR02598 family)